MDNRQHSQNKVKASKSKIQTDLEDQHGIDSDEQRARAVFVRFRGGIVGVNADLGPIRVRTSSLYSRFYLPYAI
jgi:hypothetical protein